ncbi:hypothetical protein [Flavobacterium saccharophilum]|uniref:Uncharacterized protein n=1 Tax=Flavobacterium saccharophilum TaxID=29534 RepID=A0A1M7DRL6_9FLAO|nr:hypothetical protein [Flavobacterium saccharophilum]SHL82151.1 hypothetical protein SAMN05444366_1675 [Flavobacterium saccharophilum]
MIRRESFSRRRGIVLPESNMTFDKLKELSLAIYTMLTENGYFQKYLGINCSDGFIAGELGPDISLLMFINLRKNNLYPVNEKIENYSEDDLFDILEFLHDYCSKGLERDFHDLGFGYSCGYHYSKFDDNEGKKYFRELFNPLLRDYKDGFEISDKGEILNLVDEGLSTLYNASIPTDDLENIKNKLSLAIVKFRQHKSTLEDRKDAIRELADILEFLRKDIKEFLNKKDENDIFSIANNFGIRHHNLDQKNGYDKAIWYSWIFNFYLATIHTILRIKKKKSNAHK